MNRVLLLGLALFPMAAFASSHREAPPTTRIVQLAEASSHRESPPTTRIVQLAEASSHRESPPTTRIVQLAEASSSPTALTPPQAAPVRVHRDGYTVVSALDAQ